MKKLLDTIFFIINPSDENNDIRILNNYLNSNALLYLYFEPYDINDNEINEIIFERIVMKYGDNNKLKMNSLLLLDAINYLSNIIYEYPYKNNIITKTFHIHLIKDKDKPDRISIKFPFIKDGIDYALSLYTEPVFMRYKHKKNSYNRQKSYKRKKQKFNYKIHEFITKGHKFIKNKDNGLKQHGAYIEQQIIKYNGIDMTEIFDKLYNILNISYMNYSSMKHLFYGGMNINSNKTKKNKKSKKKKNKNKKSKKKKTKNKHKKRTRNKNNK